MPENDAPVTDAETPEPKNDTTDDLASIEPPADDDPDKGAKSALVAEREARKAEREERRKLAAEIETLKQSLADRDKTAEQLAAEKALREAEHGALAKANERIARSEIKAAAKGRVAELDLLLAVVDPASIPVDDKGEVDSAAIEDAISDFLDKYPSQKADASKFSGTADQGPKGKQSKERQLTREQLKSMSPEQIQAAQDKGLLKDLLGGKS